MSGRARPRGRDRLRDRDEHDHLAFRPFEHLLRVEGTAVAGRPQAVRGQRAGQFVKRGGPPRDQPIEGYDR